MTSNALLGIVVFAAALGPAYAFVRVQEQRQPLPERSALLEAAELVFIGVFCTLLVTGVTLTVAKESDLLDTTKIADDIGRYVIEHPGRSFGFLLWIYVVSALLGHGLAHLVFKDEAPSILPGSAWTNALGRDKDSKLVWATLELEDGRGLFGQVESYAVDKELESREIVLHRPLKERTGTAWTPIENDVLIVAGTEIRTLAVQYQPS